MVALDADAPPRYAAEMEWRRDPLGYVRKTVASLGELRDAPHAIALGIAIGVFFGFLPLWGVKTLVSLGAAWLLRANKIAAVVFVNLHDLLLPFMPFLMAWEFHIGNHLLGREPGTVSQLGHLQLHELLRWTTFAHFGEPIFVGSLLVAPPLGFLSYWIALPIIKGWQSRRREKRASAS